MDKSRDYHVGISTSFVNNNNPVNIIMKNYGNNFFLVVFMISTPIFSAFASSKEVEELEAILRSSTSSSYSYLEERITQAGYTCERLEKSASGNTVIKVQKGVRYVIKVFEPSIGYPEREIHAASEAGRLGISPQVYATSKARYPYMVIEYLEGTPLSKKINWLSIDWALLKPTINLMKELHNSNIKLSSVGKSFLEKARDFFHIIEKYNVSVPSYLSTLMENYDNLIYLISQRGHFIPCHFDLHEENIFINNDKQVKFIDWECCGIGNKYLELASFSLNFRFTEEEDNILLKTYFGMDIPLESKAILYVAKLLRMGFLSAREFIRPYFKLYPPYTLLKPVPRQSFTEMLDIFEKIYPSYEDIVLQVRAGKHISYTDIEVAILLLQEYCRRVKEDKFFLYSNYLKGRYLTKEIKNASFRLLQSYQKALYVELYLLGKNDWPVTFNKFEIGCFLLKKYYENIGISLSEAQ